MKHVVLALLVALVGCGKKPAPQKYGDGFINSHPPPGRIRGALTVGTSSADTMTVNATPTFKTAVNIVGGPAVAQLPWRSLGWYFLPQGNNIASLVEPNGAVNYSPFYIGTPVTFSTFGLDIATAGDAAATVRVGIYADSGGGQPGSLIIDFGALSAASAGVVTTAQTLSLAPGWYWAAFDVQGATSQPHLYESGLPGTLSYIGKASVLTTGEVFCGWTGTAAGALPATADIFNVTGHCPRLVARVQ